MMVIIILALCSQYPLRRSFSERDLTHGGRHIVVLRNLVDVCCLVGTLVVVAAGRRPSGSLQSGGGFGAPPLMRQKVLERRELGAAAAADVLVVATLFFAAGAAPTTAGTVTSRGRDVSAGAGLLPSGHALGVRCFACRAAVSPTQAERAAPFLPPVPSHTETHHHCGRRRRGSAMTRAHTQTSGPRREKIDRFSGAQATCASAAAPTRQVRRPEARDRRQRPPLRGGR